MIKLGDYEKIRQKLEFLILNEEFNKDIQELRIKWNIPKNGFETGEEDLLWQQEKLYKATDDYTDNPGTHSKYRKAKAEKDMRKREEEIKKIDDEIPINAYHNDIKKVLSKYKILNGNFKDSIEGYIKTNKINPHSPFILHEKGDLMSENREIHIRIFPETTLKDIQNNWWMVEELKKHRWGKQKSKRQRPLDNFSLEKRIYELKKEGKSYKAISKIIKEEFKLLIPYDQISTHYQRFTKKVRNI